MRSLVVLVLAVVCVVSADDCPQGTCESDQTCCPGPSPGQFGCCPDPNAVCCSDGLHCCPEDTACNLSQGTCDSSSTRPLIPHIFRKKPDPKKVAVEMPVANKVEIIYCPGGQYYCQDGNTCCLLPTGQYGCCPYPSATCCSDGYHCCPSGSRCDPTFTYCLKGGNKYAALFKRQAYSLV